MKHYLVTKTVINQRGRVLSSETWSVCFETIAEMNYYMTGKWSMAEDNEIFVAVLINY